MAAGLAVKWLEGCVRVSVDHEGVRFASSNGSITFRAREVEMSGFKPRVSEYVAKNPPKKIVYIALGANIRGGACGGGNYLGLDQDARLNGYVVSNIALDYGKGAMALSIELPSGYLYERTIIQRRRVTLITLPRRHHYLYLGEESSILYLV